MAILTYVPQPPLAEFVEVFWYCDGGMLPHSKERVLPTGDAQLVISLRDAPLRTYHVHGADRTQIYRGPLVCGPRSEHSIIDTAPLASSMGVQFKPGGAFPFLGVPIGELHNSNVSLESLWGRKADELHDRLCEAGEPLARFQILAQFLFSHLHTAWERHPAVAYALTEFQAASQYQTIAEVTKRTGLSLKWLIELFRAEVGLTPKLYCRLRRFQASLKLMARQPQPDWADIALTCGYFDQAHFNRDFRAFSGLSPTAYLAHRTEHQNHVRFAD